MPPTKAPMSLTTRFRIRPPPPNRTPTIQPAINPFSAIMISGVKGRICSSVVIARSSCSTPPNVSVSDKASWGMNSRPITDPAMQSGHSWWFYLPVCLVEEPEQETPDYEHIENDAKGVLPEHALAMPRSWHRQHHCRLANPGRHSREAGDE